MASVLDSEKFPGAIPDYLHRFHTNQIVMKNHSENTAYKYAYHVSLFMRWLLYQMGAPEDVKDVDTLRIEQVAAVTSDDIKEFLLYAYQHGAGVNARSAMLSALSAFYDYLIDEERVCTQNPAAKIERPKIPVSLPKYLSVEEADHLLETVQSSKQANNVRDYCILAFFLTCGIRLDELYKIDVDDIHKETRILTVIGKGAKPRELYIGDMLMGAIDDWLVVRKRYDPDGDKKALFVSRQGGRLTSSAVQKMVKRRFLEAGLDPKKLSAHKLRHTAATIMYKSSGGDIRSIQEILGHSSLSSTQIYTHVNNKQKAAVIKSNPLNLEEKQDEN